MVWFVRARLFQVNWLEDETWKSKQHCFATDIGHHSVQMVKLVWEITKKELLFGQKVKSHLTFILDWPHFRSKLRGLNLVVNKKKDNMLFLEVWSKIFEDIKLEINIMVFLATFHFNINLCCKNYRDNVSPLNGSFHMKTSNESSSKTFEVA